MMQRIGVQLGHELSVDEDHARDGFNSSAAQGQT